MLALPPFRPSRKPSLTPMIDVVFLLLVFFMLASQFGHDSALTLSPAGGDAAYSGPPRLVEIGPDGLRLNGAPVAEAALAEALAPLTTGAEDVIVLRSADATSLQRLIDVAQTLRAAGFATLAVVP
ncbi:biopolymer transporter ExbD [Roseovarius sp. LXJ103]|uniref:ExbD/TolR family protein n=1 Tax=Roseovarius carneus TaxID=2853164 RepID=UPI000D60F039|nr:biopolymer transporter ExbD [Roseovarius carneus]MBZ8118602.1 biopolymer transporter ExbD [Roseovarius carneus]PWE35710.1 biopolymer transporter ExbD [Pelagicola sp. LXJ1103]